MKVPQKSLQVGVLRGTAVADEMWEVFIAPLVLEGVAFLSELKSVREYCAEASVWKLYLGRSGKNGEQLYPILCALPEPKLVKLIGGMFETAGDCVAEGTLDEVWPHFENYARML